jgi:predicted nucleic acid-binding protein
MGMQTLRTVSETTITIADSSVIIAFGIIQRFDILNKLYRTIFVPEAVYHEVCIRGAGKPGDAELRQSLSEWIHRVQPAKLIAPPYFGMRQGEIEVISYGVEQKALGGLVRVLLDDRLGRRRALQEGLQVIGTLGTLKLAKRYGILAAVRPIIDNLALQGFRVSATIQQSVLTQVGEL